MNRIGLILGLIIILISNVLALVGVYQNSSGEPSRSIELTERELPMQPRDKDDSSIRLRLVWRRTAAQFFPLPADYEYPFDRAKLQELGFDCSWASNEAPEYRVPMARPAFVALEYQGARWEQWQKNLPESPAKEAAPAAPSISMGSRRAFESLEGTHPEGTRLFVVDASEKLEVLLQKYPDPQKYLVVRGVISAVLDGGRDTRSGSYRPFRWGGYVSQLLPPEINIPLPHSHELSSLSPQSGGAPRYRVTLRYGSRLEPRVTSVRLQTEPKAPN